MLLVVGRILKSTAKLNYLSKVYGLASLTTMADRLSLFQTLGLSQQKAKETIKNEALSQKLESIVLQVKINVLA
jgi:hypothetical protein